MMLWAVILNNETESDSYSLVSLVQALHILSNISIFHDATLGFFKTQHPNYYKIFIFTDHNSKQFKVISIFKDTCNLNFLYKS